MSPKSEQIVKYIKEHGPQSQQDLADALDIRLSNMSHYLQKPLDDGLLVFDLIRSVGSVRPIRIYRLSDAAVKSKEQEGTGFSQYNPADPFGLVAKGKQINAGVAKACDFIADKISTLHEPNQSEVQATVLGNDAPVAEKPVSVAENPAFLPKDTGSVSQNTPPVPEKAASVSEIAPAVTSSAYHMANADVAALVRDAEDAIRPTTQAPVEPPIPAFLRRDDQPAAEPEPIDAPDFLVALLSNSKVEIRIDGKTVTLTKARWTHMREFLNKVELA